MTQKTTQKTTQDPQPHTPPQFEWTRTGLPRRQFLQATSVLGATALAGAGVKSAFAQEDEGTLKVRSYADIRSLDPAFSQGVIDEEVQGAIYSKLVQFIPGRTWGWQKDAADMIEQVDDTHIKFALRDDVGFTNGFGAMTAEDVKYSFERITDSKLKSTNATDWSALDRVEVTGEREGTIILKHAFQPVWSIALPYVVGNIVSKRAFEAMEGEIETKAPASSGPYQHNLWRRGDKNVLTRNPQWRGTPAAFNQVNITYVKEEKSAELAFEAGELDFTRVSITSVGRLKKSRPRKTTLEEYPSLAYVWVGMNLDNEKLKNKKLRQAIQHAIDVPEIMEDAYFGGAQPATGIIGPGLAGYRPNSLVPPEHDLKQAKQLMEESGVGKINLTIDMLDGRINRLTAKVIEKNLEEIGIKLEVRLHKTAAFWTLGDESAGDQWKDVELILKRFSMDPDPYYATSWFTCDRVGSWNWERFCDAEFDQIHADAQVEPDPAKRAEMYRRAQDIMEETGAFRFLTHEATPIIYRNRIIPALRPDGEPLLRYFTLA